MKHQPFCSMRFCGVPDLTPSVAHLCYQVTLHDLSYELDFYNNPVEKGILQNALEHLESLEPAEKRSAQYFRSRRIRMLRNRIRAINKTKEAICEKMV